MNSQEYRIKYALTRKLMTLSELATHLSTDTQTIRDKLERGLLKRTELEKIAEILGAEYKTGDYLILPNGPKIGGAAMQEKTVKTAAAYNLTPLTKIAEALKTSPQNLSNRLKRGSLKREELEKIAEILGAEYVREEYFIFPDGTKI